MTAVPALPALSLDALTAVRWDPQESDRAFPIERVPQVLRGIALDGVVAEPDGWLLELCLLGRGGDRVNKAATEALPFLVALAADPGVRVRTDLLDLLKRLDDTAQEAEPHRIDGRWPAAWRHQQPALLVLLADGDAEVRRSALSFARHVAPLLERWRAETEPSVRLNLLWELGRAAAGEAARGTLAGAAAEEVRAVFEGEVRDGSPAMRIAALEGWADLDLDVLERHADLLMEVFAGGDVEETRRDFEKLSYLPEAEAFWSREYGLHGVMLRFADAPGPAVSFLVRLAGKAARNGDVPLLRAALECAWDLLVDHRSVEPALLHLAGSLLTCPDPGARLWAAYVLAALGARSEPYADLLAALVDDEGEDELLEGTVACQARWALTRIGDPRGLPGLVEQLYEPSYRAHHEEGCSWENPRLPEIDDVLGPLRDQADLLLPALRKVLRWRTEEQRLTGYSCSSTGRLLRVLTEWEEAALPALPEVVALLPHQRHWAVEAVVAMGPGAASAEDAVRACGPGSGDPLYMERCALRVGGHTSAELRLVGEELTGRERSAVLLARFGSEAVAYAPSVRELLDGSAGVTRLDAAVTLWSITGEPEPSASVLEEFVLPVADGGDDWGNFLVALRTLARIGRITPEARAALHTVKGFDRRLSPGRDYTDVLQDQRIRAAIDEVLALP
ncbi:HEAT repeat domain-containing protein [Streptomyces sp. NPDC060198]|uniref:HEAT repeat domain-containing protein n=1 Tax=Streptomyces sp. NPDC060198 TaxID=3347070 RepID=UPI00364C0BF9